MHTKVLSFLWKLYLPASLVLCPACSNEDEFALKFITKPTTKNVNYHEEFQYRFEAEDPEGGEVSYSVDIPDWLTYEDDLHEITGTAGWNGIGDYQVKIAATTVSGKSRTQSFELIVDLGEIDCDANFGDPTQSLYILPYNVGESYKIFQSNCSTGGHANTFAYDFLMDIGDTVRASRAGRVIRVHESFVDGVDTQSGKENNVFIRHSDGTVLRYTHLKHMSVVVSENQEVEPGDFLGLSGNTGATGGVPHLHFALYRATNYSRKYSLPVNFRNAYGPLDAKNALIWKESYLATPY